LEEDFHFLSKKLNVITASVKTLGPSSAPGYIHGRSDEVYLTTAPVHRRLNP